MNSLKDLKEYIEGKDNSRNFTNSSEIPLICKTEPCMLGVDEAGRGPVLGPMVYGIAYCPLSKKTILESLGCADSKALTEDKRDDIFTKMLTEDESKSNVGWSSEIISPNYISNSMYRRSKHSLNEVSMNSAIGLIKKVLEEGVNLAEIYVDTVGPPEKYQAKLVEIFPSIKITVEIKLNPFDTADNFTAMYQSIIFWDSNNLKELSVAKKADSIYPIVSAASIVAKVTRDHALKVWKFKEGLEMDHTQFGSGYPGDPLTKKFIRDQIDNVFGYPLLVRFSWSTAELMLQEKAATCSFEEVEEASPNKKAAGTKSISCFFSPKDEKKSRKRHKFFGERHLTVTNPFG